MYSHSKWTLAAIAIQQQQSEVVTPLCLKTLLTMAGKEMHSI